MPHPTEGELHAYVDGALAASDPPAVERLVAHLAACADCVVRLEQARSVRDESAALLGIALGEAGEPPPFEELVHRSRQSVSTHEGASHDAGRGAGTEGLGRGTAQRSSRERLAWAASIAVALGAGWMGRALLDQQPLASNRFAEAPAAVDAIAVPSDRDAKLESDDVALESTDARQQSVEASADPLAVDTQGRVARDEAEPTQPSDAPAGERGNARRARADREAEPGPVGLRSVTEETVASPEESARPGAQRTEPQTASVVEGEAPSREASVGKAAPSLSDVNESAFADEGLDDLVWRFVEQEEAEAAVGRPIPHVPGLEVMDYAIADSEEPRPTRLRQRLPGGEILELIAFAPSSGVADQAAPVSELRERAAVGRDLAGSESPPPETSGPSEGLSAEWFDVDGVRLRLLAPIALDSLRALVSRIR